VGTRNIGQGIAAGGDITLILDQSTNNKGCDQYVKVVYADGSESGDAKFNSCEVNLELAFKGSL